MSLDEEQRHMSCSYWLLNWTNFKFTDQVIDQLFWSTCELAGIEIILHSITFFPGWSLSHLRHWYCVGYFSRDDQVEQCLNPLECNSSPIAHCIPEEFGRLWKWLCSLFCWIVSREIFELKVLPCVLGCVICARASWETETFWNTSSFERVIKRGSTEAPAIISMSRKRRMQGRKI